MKSPYHVLPVYTRWNKVVAGVAIESMDPVAHFPWQVTPEQKVATAGSCFAQHIARHLRRAGFNYYVVEDGHPIGAPEEKADFNYGTFSGRYGNVYTTRQLVQLFQRAFNLFTPQEGPWETKEGRIVDPFRPNIQPHGFFSAKEMEADREQHLSAVKIMFETLDVFVFTLGLTEAWRSRTDGAVFPICPGVAGGTFDPDKYEFVNLSVMDAVNDLKTFFAMLHDINPKAKIILTVSPVPLMATALDEHVLVSTTYSKSALRAAVGEVTGEYDHVAYFPSFEIITGSYTRGRYFAEDLRSVTEEGVEHVMGLFLKHVANVSPEASAKVAVKPAQPDSFLSAMQHVVQTTCDEELIDASLKS